MIQEYLTRPQVEKITGFSCSTVYRLMAAGEFPRPIRLGKRHVRWIKSEIEDWLSACPRAEGDKAAA